MPVKRIPHPAGDRPDLVEWEGDGPEELDALAEVLNANTPKARIKKIAETMPERAAELFNRLSPDGSADNLLLADIATAETTAQDLSTLKPRQRERNRLKNLPTAKESHELWRSMASEIWEKNPSLKKTDVARQIRRKLSWSHELRDHMRGVETIRKRI